MRLYLLCFVLFPESLSIAALMLAYRHTRFCQPQEFAVLLFAAPVAIATMSLLIYGVCFLPPRRGRRPSWMEAIFMSSGQALLFRTMDGGGERPDEPIWNRPLLRLGVRGVGVVLALSWVGLLAGLVTRVLRHVDYGPLDFAGLIGMLVGLVVQVALLVSLTLRFREYREDRWSEEHGKYNGVPPPSDPSIDWYTPILSEKAKRRTFASDSPPATNQEQSTHGN